MATRQLFYKVCNGLRGQGLDFIDTSDPAREALGYGLEIFLAQFQVPLAMQLKTEPALKMEVDTAIAVVYKVMQSAYLPSPVSSIVQQL